MTKSPLVLLRPDFGPSVGGGHVMRGLSLARALIDQGARCAVSLTADAAAALAPFIPQGVTVVNSGEDLSEDAVVFDNYRLGAEAEAPMMAAGKLVCVIDDLADRHHACDLLVDVGYGRSAADYDGLVSAGTEVLTGPAYALLRPEFAAARPAALARRNASSGRRVLVSLGLTDVGAITARVCAVLPRSVRTDVILGAAAPSLGAVQGLANVTIHTDATNVAELMSAADLAIGAGGSSTWERACLGLPTISLILADNQAAMTMALADAGVLVAIDARQTGWEGGLTEAISALIADSAQLAKLSTRAAALCDGQGAARVAAALLAKLA